MIAWVKGELEKDGDITWAEAKGAMEEWAKSQNYAIPEPMMKAAEAGFNAIDSNGDGKLVEEELKAAFPDHDEHEEHEGEDPIKARLLAELDKDGKITWKDVKKIVKDMTDGRDIGKEAWKTIKKHFKEADTDNNGHVDRAELEAAFAKH